MILVAQAVPAALLQAAVELALLQEQAPEVMVGTALYGAQQVLEVVVVELEVHQDSQ